MNVHVMAEIMRIAGRQKGVVAHRQALGAGASASTIARWVRTGVWRRVRKGVYMVAGAIDSWELRAMSAVLAAGPGAVLSHASAAHLWRLPRSPRPPRFELWVPASNKRRIEGVVLHRSENLTDEDRTCHDDIPVTTVTRTIVDVADTRTPDELWIWRRSRSADG